MMVDPQKIAALYADKSASALDGRLPSVVEMQIPSQSQSKWEKVKVAGKTAGEVRFIKDRGGDKNEWGWGSPGPSERHINEDFTFNPKYLKPLAQAMRSALMALGHVTSAHARFVKVKSRNVSPDGSIGGQGYIQTISDMRRQLMNCIEALSSFTDSVYDEINAPHWNPAEDTLSPRDRDEVKEIVEDAEDIKDDPEGWAEDEEEDSDEDSLEKMAARVIQKMWSAHV